MINTKERHKQTRNNVEAQVFTIIDLYVKIELSGMRIDISIPVNFYTRLMLKEHMYDYCNNNADSSG